MSVQPLSERLIELRRRVLAHEAAGDFSAATLAELAEALDQVEGDLRATIAILDEHAALRPSGAWIAISVLSGLGGLFLIDLTPFSLLVALGGAAGAIKSLLDLARHTTREQLILRVYWQVHERKAALATGLAARAIVPSRGKT